MRGQSRDKRIGSRWHRAPITGTSGAVACVRSAVPNIAPPIRPVRASCAASAGTRCDPVARNTPLPARQQAHTAPRVRSSAAGKLSMSEESGARLSGAGAVPHRATREWLARGSHCVSVSHECYPSEGDSAERDRRSRESLDCVRAYGCYANAPPAGVPASTAVGLGGVAYRPMSAIGDKTFPTKFFANQS
jgi:hypothetical protein